MFYKYTCYVYNVYRLCLIHNVVYLVFLAQVHAIMKSTSGLHDILTRAPVYVSITVLHRVTTCICLVCVTEKLHGEYKST